MADSNGNNDMTPLLGKDLPALYTLGYSKFKPDEFADILNDAGISTVADVRSIPYSSRYRCFNREALANRLNGSGIGYIWLGDDLGGLKGEGYIEIETLSDMERKLNEPSFRHGCELLRGKLDSGPVSLLCAENDPLNCHRAILVGHLIRKLYPEIDIRHIWKPKGDMIIESQNDLDARALSAFAGKANAGFSNDFLDQAYAGLNRAFARKGRKR